MPRKNTIDIDALAGEAENKTKVHFSDKLLHKLMSRPPNRYTDEGCPGLRFVVNAKHEGRFQSRYQEARTGKSKTRNLKGQFLKPVPRPNQPAFKRHISIADARTLNNNIRSDAKDGLTPNVVQNRKRADAITFRMDIDTYMDMNRARWRKWRFRRGSPYTTRREHWLRAALDRHTQALMDLPTETITTEDIADVLRAMLERPSGNPHIKTAQPMLRSVISLRGAIYAIIAQAMGGKDRKRWRDGAQHPCVGLRFLLKLPKRKVRPHPGVPIVGDEHDEGIQDLYARLSHYETTTAPKYRLKNGSSMDFHGHPLRGAANLHQTRMTHLAVMFLMLTCAPRKGEVLYAQWKHIHMERDDPQWWVPDTTMKVSKDDREWFIRPLSHAAVRLLRMIKPADAKPDDYIFTNSRKGTPISETTMNVFMGRWAPGKTPHGFRHTMSGYMTENYPQLLLALQLSLDHEIKTVIGATDSYMKASLMGQRRIMAEIWADLLEGKLPLAERTERPASYWDWLYPRSGLIRDALPDAGIHPLQHLPLISK